MKKVGIITMIDLDNYGNRLQCYALNYYCNKVLNVDAYTLKNKWYLNNNNLFLDTLRFHKYKIQDGPKRINKERKKNFKLFEKNIKYYHKRITSKSNLNSFDYLIVGSDQVWNPNFLRLRNLDVLKNIDVNKRISYAPSFGINKIEDKYIDKLKEISKFKYLSVREECGKKIIAKVCNRSDIEVLIDPTMLLSNKEWDKIIKKPKEIDNIKENKYILCYFLGELSQERKLEIEKFAKKNTCYIINILDKKDIFNKCGPDEFLYLEKNAYLICTDSYHSSVFAFLFNRPFIVYERKKTNTNIGSRLETFINKFDLNDRKYNNKQITKENLKYNYTGAYKVLEKERKKAHIFLENALELRKERN